MNFQAVKYCFAVSRLRINGMFFLILLTSFCSDIYAQRWQVMADFGHSSSLGKASSGYALSVGLHRSLSSRSSFALELDNTFNSSRGLLQNIKEDGIFALRYAENEAAWPFATGWDRSSFPTNSLPAKPNRYYNFNINLAYYYKIMEKSKFSVRKGLAFTLTYHDQMEIFSILETSIIRFPEELVIQPMSVPIFAYDTYLDIGVSPRLSFAYKLSERLQLGWNNRLYFFPISDTAIFASAFSFGVDIR